VVVGALCVSLRLDGCRSLKDKRQILRSLLDRMRREFRVAAAETGDHELWGNAEIGVSYVSTSPTHAESVLQHVLDLLDACPELSVESVEREIVRM
jgi:uncharacterized protein